MQTQTLATTLGWVSIGLGLAEVAAARQVGTYLGIEQHPGLLRLFGLREIASGVEILLHSQTAEHIP